MSKYFSISGYWKDDKSTFNGLIVKEYDDVEEKESDDNNIFYYGMNEEDLKNSSVDDTSEFVVTNYDEIDWVSR